MPSMQKKIGVQIFGAMKQKFLLIFKNKLF